jgi:hypothetical protein
MDSANVRKVKSYAFNEKTEEDLAFSNKPVHSVAPKGRRVTGGLN